MRREAFKTACGIAAALVLAVGGVARAQTEPERTGGPYVPTPQVVVDQMLRMANVRADDYVIDLGSGDGVIVLTAVQQFKARGMGVEIDPELVKLANEQAAKLGIADRAKFEVMDVFRADLSKASVVTLYLLPGMMINLRPKIYLDLKPGTRVVSHDYHFDDWRADDSISFDVPEKEKINGVPRATVWLWVIPARIAGRWSMAVDGGEKYDVTWRQNYQVIEGTAQSGGRGVKVQDAALRGEQVEFTVASGAARQAFKGVVKGDAMQGTVDVGQGKILRWTAVRTGPAASTQKSASIQ